MADRKRKGKRSSGFAQGPATIKVEYNLLKPDLVTLDDGYAIPRKFKVKAEFKDQPLNVEIDVEIEGKRARSRKVHVSTNRPGGVSSTTLRSVPIRDVVADGCSMLLYKGGFKTATEFGYEMPGRYGPAEIEAVKQLVGYVEAER